MNIQHLTSNIQRPARKATLRCLSGIGTIAICLFAWNCSAQTNANANTNATANVNSGPTYENFQIITRNNIFDPNRTGRSRFDSGPRTPRRQVNRFSLVGTMSYPKGKFAFFDSPNADYKKVLEPGGSIAGYTVKDVTASSITLASNGKEFEMKVGTQMTRNDGETTWRLAGHYEEPENTDSTNEATATDSQNPTAAPTGATPEMSDRLKQMMERRNQELSK